LAQIFVFFRSWSLVGFSSGILSLTAEAIQYTFQVGVLDVDDVILNTLGGFLGYCGFVIWIIYSTTLSKK